ncbi:MAG: helix-turn-helix domain-containing protein [Saprospiraceae bacterium]
MNNKHIYILPIAEKMLRGIGENVKLARKRRRLSEGQMAERAGISRSTVQLLEKGEPGVSMSAYVQVLFVLGLEEDLKKIASDDPLGRRLQDADIINPKK